MNLRLGNLKTAAGWFGFGFLCMLQGGNVLHKEGLRQGRVEALKATQGKGKIVYKNTLNGQTYTLGE